MAHAKIIADDEIGPSKGLSPAPRWAMTTFVALFAMNMLDFLDRNLLMSMQPQIKGELAITNFQWGLLTSIFLVSYSLFGPVMGWLGDRFRRTWLIGVGVGVWSLATIGSGLAQSYGHTGGGAERAGNRRGHLRRHRADDLARPVCPRAAGPLDVGLLPGDADRQRARESPGLDHRIQAELAPGVLPGRCARAGRGDLGPRPSRAGPGRSEGVDTERLKAAERAGARREDYFGLMANASYIYSVLGMAAYTFAIGGMLVWVPNYLFSTRGFDQARAGTILGVVTLGAAVLGMSAGGWIADRLAKTKPEALFLVPAVAMFGSIPFVLIAPFRERRAGDLRRDLSWRRH